MSIEVQAHLYRKTKADTSYRVNIVRKPLIEGIHTPGELGI